MGRFSYRLYKDNIKIKTTSRLNVKTVSNECFIYKLILFSRIFYSLLNYLLQSFEFFRLRKWWKRKMWVYTQTSIYSNFKINILLLLVVNWDDTSRKQVTVFSTSLFLLFPEQPWWLKGLNRKRSGRNQLLIKSLGGVFSSFGFKTTKKEWIKMIMYKILKTFHKSCI